MYFHIMTLFPEMVLGGLNESITGKAIEKGLIGVDAVNIRDFAGNRYGHVDDYTYGGGAGMLMQPGPVYDAYQHVLAQIAVRKEKKGTSAQAKKVRVLYMTPQGQPFKQCMAEEYAKEEDLVLLCGHYDCDRLCVDWRFCTDGWRTSGDDDCGCNKPSCAGRAWKR